MPPPPTAESRPRQEEALLLVEDDPMTSELLCLMLRNAGLQPIHACTSEEAFKTLGKRPHISAAIIDLSLPDGDGIDVMREALRIFPTLPCFVLSAEESVKTVVFAMKAGASDYFVKPFDPDAMAASLKSAMWAYSENAGTLAKSPQSLEAVRHWKAPKMRAAMEIAMKAASTSSPVMVTGCHDTGKKSIAQLIHQVAGKTRPLTILNAAHLNPAQMAHELFGRPGLKSFNAPVNSMGKLASSSGSNLYIENIDSLSLQLQADLLDWIHAPKQKFPSKLPRCRLIASMTTDPISAIQQGHFRQDLWYALSVFHVEVPSLADRQNDLDLLCEDIITSICIKRKLRRPSLTRHAMESIKDRSWPGNLSELQSVLEHAIVHTQDRLIGPGDLPLLHRPPPPLKKQAPSEMPLGATSFDELAKAHLLAALEACDGNRRRAAKRLNISLRTVYNMIRRYGINSSQA